MVRKYTILLVDPVYADIVNSINLCDVLRLLRVVEPVDLVVQVSGQVVRKVGAAEPVDRLREEVLVLVGGDLGDR